MNNIRCIKDLGEMQLIDRIVSIIGYQGNDIIGGSDDVIGIPPPPDEDHVLLVNTDMLVSTTDVPKEMSLLQAGRKAVVMACSDLIVKGCEPQWANVSLGLPQDLSIEDFNDLITGLKKGFDLFDTKYLGGDLNATLEVIVDITVMGYMPRELIIHRKGAQVGDLIYTTGNYGLNGLGLKLLLDESFSLPPELESKRKIIINSVLNPKTNSELGMLLASLSLVNASADSSDGLLKTISEICKASKVGCNLNWEQIPKSPLIVEYGNLTDDDIGELVLATGEEFTHIFTVSPKHKSHIEKSFSDVLCLIGEITSSEKGMDLVFPDSNIIDFKDLNLGYNHFE